MLKALQFHRILPDFQFCGTWNSPGQFEEFLHFLSTQKVKIILPGEDSDGIIVTFDDGERSIYEYAFPVLKKFGIKAIIFLIVDYIGKKNLWDISLTGKRTEHLSWDEITDMRNSGIQFGSHGMTHRNLTTLSILELEYELIESKRILEGMLGPINAISYPFNRVSELVVKKAREAGYEYGFGGDGANNLLIKKEAIYITENLNTLKTKIFEKPRFLYQYERTKQKVINYFTIATMLNRKH